MAVCYLRLTSWTGLICRVCLSLRLRSAGEVRREAIPGVEVVALRKWNEAERSRFIGRRKQSSNQPNQSFCLGFTWFTCMANNSSSSSWGKMLVSRQLVASLVLLLHHDGNVWALFQVIHSMFELCWNGVSLECQQSHLSVAISTLWVKSKKKLHFYLLDVGTLFCYMCCNSEDMWVFGGLMSHDCNTLGVTILLDSWQSCDSA